MSKKNLFNSLVDGQHVSVGVQSNLHGGILELDQLAPESNQTRLNVFIAIWPGFLTLFLLEQNVISRVTQNSLLSLSPINGPELALLFQRLGPSPSPDIHLLSERADQLVSQAVHFLLVFLLDGVLCRGITNQQQKTLKDQTPPPPLPTQKESKFYRKNINY